MKRNIISFLATPLISPFVMLFIAISHMRITSRDYFEYQVLTDLQFQLLLVAVVFLIFTLSIPIFFYFWKIRYVRMQYFLILGSIWGLIPLTMIASKLIRFEGLLYTLEMLILAAAAGASIFLIYWFLAVRQNEWWENP